MSVVQDESRLLAPPPVQPERSRRRRDARRPARRPEQAPGALARHGRRRGAARDGRQLAGDQRPVAVVGRDAVPDLAVGPDRACGGPCASRSPPPSSGFGLGTVLALMRLSRSPLLRSVAWGYTWVFRSVPLILQLCSGTTSPTCTRRSRSASRSGRRSPRWTPCSIVGKFGAAVLGLGLSQAAYSAEIVRAGILGVDQGQHEAAAALGIPRSRQQRRIMLPQAMRTIVPTPMNEIIGLVKGTSVVYVLAYGELFYIGRRHLRPQPQGGPAAHGRGDLVPGRHHAC